MCEKSDVFQSMTLENSPLGGRPDAVRRRWYRGFRPCRPEGRKAYVRRVEPMNGQVKSAGSSGAGLTNLPLETFAMNSIVRRTSRRFQGKQTDWASFTPSVGRSHPRRGISH